MATSEGREVCISLMGKIQSIISQKLKIAKIWNSRSHPFQDIAHLLGQNKVLAIFFQFSGYSRYKVDQISKTKNRKNRKIVFFISFSTLRIFYSNIATYEREGLHVINWVRAKLSKWNNFQSSLLFLDKLKMKRFFFGNLFCFDSKILVTIEERGEGGVVFR